MHGKSSYLFPGHVLMLDPIEASALSITKLYYMSGPMKLFVVFSNINENSFFPPSKTEKAFQFSNYALISQSNKT